jgi:2'-5' RNA ligase
MIKENGIIKIEGGIIMNCGIAIFPSKEIQDIANSYRKRFDPHYNRIAPHLTLREPEQWDSSQLTAAAGHLEQVTQTITPFDIHFNRFSSFYPALNVIYMALSNPEPLKKAQALICNGELAENNRPYHFNPHLTVGQQLGDDELHDVLASLKKTELDLTSRVDRIHLLYQTDNHAWTVHQTFLFRGVE